MKYQFLLLLPLSLYIFSSSLQAEVKLPKNVDVIYLAEGYWDGGSCIIEFSDESGVKWQMFHNLSLDAPKEKLDTITLTEIKDFGIQKIRTDGQILIRGSQEETEIIQEIRKAINEIRFGSRVHLKVVEEFLAKKKAQQVAGGDAAR